MSSLSVILTGQPNCGKSSIFNHLTGLRQKVGNFAGVTVEKKTATIDYKGRSISIVDLPGAYSLSARSQEEQIVSDYFKENKPDIVLDIVDASNLARNLFLTLQLLEQGIPLIINLNMMDEAEKLSLIHI